MDARLSPLLLSHSHKPIAPIIAASLPPLYVHQRRKFARLVDHALSSLAVKPSGLSTAIPFLHCTREPANANRTEVTSTGFWDG